MVFIKNIGRFIKSNLIIFIVLIISIAIIISYILTANLKELFVGAERWYNLFFQLSIGYVINFMFYVTQIYIPNNKRNSIMRNNISRYLDESIDKMRSNISELVSIYVEEHKGDEYTKEELRKISDKLELSDKTKMHNIYMPKSFGDSPVFYTVKEWIWKCIFEVEEDIDIMYKYYEDVFTDDLRDVLEDIRQSEYHKLKNGLLLVPDLKITNGYNIFVQYYELTRRLEDITAKEYNIK